MYSTGEQSKRPLNVCGARETLKGLVRRRRRATEQAHTVRALCARACVCVNVLCARVRVCAVRLTGARRALYIVRRIASSSRRDDRGSGERERDNQPSERLPE